MEANAKLLEGLLDVTFDKADEELHRNCPSVCEVDHRNCPSFCEIDTYEQFVEAKRKCNSIKRKKRKEKLAQDLEDFNLALFDIQEFEQQQKLVNDVDSLVTDLQPHSSPATHFLHSPPLAIDPLISFESGQLNDEPCRPPQQQPPDLPQLDILSEDLALSDESPPFSPLPDQITTDFSSGLPLSNENGEDDDNDGQSTPRSPWSPQSYATYAAVADLVDDGKCI